MGHKATKKNIMDYKATNKKIPWTTKQKKCHGLQSNNKNTMDHKAKKMPWTTNKNKTIDYKIKNAMDYKTYNSMDYKMKNTMDYKIQWTVK